MSLEQTGAHKASLHRSGSSGAQQQRAYTHTNQAVKMHIGGRTQWRTCVGCGDTPRTHELTRKDAHALKWAGWSGSVVAQINGVSQY